MLKIVGDINLTDGFFDTGFGVGSRIKAGMDPFHNIQRDKSDLWIGNFEGVTANTSDKKGLAAKQFVIDPKSLSSFKHMDIYNVANNHVMQHGAEAYKEMIESIKGFGADYFGVNDKRYTRFNHQGKSVAICGFNLRPENFSKNPLYWAMPECEDIAKTFREISGDDVKIAYVHWGNEFMNYPYIDQVKFAHWLVDLGFDLIIGMHPHILQGFEVYKGKHIFYSLGNFVFDMPWYKTHYSIIVSVDCSKENLKVDYQYVELGADYCPSVVDENCVPEDCRFEHLNKLLENIPENENYYQQLFAYRSAYRKSNYKSLIKNIGKFKAKDLTDILTDFVNRKLGRA